MTIKAFEMRAKIRQIKIAIHRAEKMVLSAKPFPIDQIGAFLQAGSDEGQWDFSTESA